MSIFSRIFGRKPASGAIIEAKAPLPPKRDDVAEPATGPRRMLSPLGIIATEMLADGGNLTLAADLCHAFRGDGRVQAALSQRIGGLLSLPLSWEDGAKKSARVKKAIADDFFEGLRECDLFALYTWGVLLGVGVAEILWKQGQSGRFIPTLKVWDPRWLSYGFGDGFAPAGWSVIDADGTPVPVTPGDGHWVLYTPRGDRAPWRNGLWRALNKPFFVKDDASLSWARFNEVFGSPLRVATGTQGMSQKQLDAIADSVDTSKGYTSAAIPFGSKLEIVEASGSTWGTFQGAIDWAAAEISIAILGQNLTTQVQSGSLAAAKTHKAVEDMLIESDAQAESTWLHEQVLSWWALYNFGDAALAPWPKRELAEPEDLTATAELYKGAGDAVLSLKTAGFPVDIEALAEKFGIPLDASAAEPQPQTPQAQPEPGQNGENPPETPEGSPEQENAEKPPSAAAGGVVWMAAKGNPPITEADLPTGASAGFDALDAMAAHAEKSAAPIIEDQSDKILSAIDKAKDPDELAELLKVAFVEMESGELNAILERALILADLEGRWSVLEDV